MRATSPFLVDDRACIQVLTRRSVVADGRRTRAIRRSNWRRSSSSTATSPANDASRSRTRSVSPSDRSRSGSRTAAWKSRRRRCRSWSWTRWRRHGNNSSHSSSRLWRCSEMLMLLATSSIADVLILHCVAKKTGTHQLMALTSSNLSRLSKFFYRWRYC